MIKLFKANVTGYPKIGIVIIYVVKKTVYNKMCHMLFNTVVIHDPQIISAASTHSLPISPKPNS